MMDIQVLIGMPLGYAKSVLERENIPYAILMTQGRSRFFQRDEQRMYVVRTLEENGIVKLLVNPTLVCSASVGEAIRNREGRQ